jgi:hypothetical protein
VSLLASLCIHTQDTTKFYYNIETTGDKPVVIYCTYYYKDSSKTSSSYKLSKDTKSSTSTSKQNTYIRADIYAIEESTRDTVFAKSFDLVKNPSIVADVSKGPIDHIKTLVISAPRLRIKSKDFQQIILNNSTVEFKLKTKKNIEGKVLSFNSTSITILDKSGEEIKITKDDIVGVKKCRGISIGNSFSALYNCNYSSVSNLTFKIVHEEYDQGKRNWVWK